MTLDTGALIALERGDARVHALVRSAAARGSVVIPSVVVAEWWRDQRGPAARLIDAYEVEPVTRTLARVAGSALARTGSGPSTTDAIVMASAALRGDLVLTSDIDDLERLRTVFPSVRLLRV